KPRLSMCVSGARSPREFTCPTESQSQSPEAGQLWLDRKRGNGNEEDALRTEEVHVRLHIVSATVQEGTLNDWPGQLGDVKLSKLTSPMCDSFALHLLKTKSRYTARRVLSKFKAIFREAQRRGLVGNNPARPVKIEESDREKAPLQIGVDIP